VRMQNALRGSRRKSSISGARACAGHFAWL
jgi:hypothetical protein